LALSANKPRVLPWNLLLETEVLNG
jgi:hypothetical protein